MNKEIINTWIDIERKMAAKHGPFRLFGLFMKEEVWNKWFVLASAPWIDELGLDSRLLIGEQYSNHFSGQDMLHFAGIQLFDENHPSVQDVLEEVNVEHGKVLLKDFDFDGFTIGRAYIISAQVLDCANSVDGTATLRPTVD